MNKQKSRSSLSMTDTERNKKHDGDELTEQPSLQEAVDAQKDVYSTSSFWRERTVEAGLIVSMALYCILGNPYFHTDFISPLLTLPFLCIFFVLSWYRLPVAVALVPLALPYYYQLQKPVWNHMAFSWAEISLWACVLVALAQMIWYRKNWQYRFSFPQLWNRLGIFAFPIALFVAAAALSILVAYSRSDAARAFREEVFDPVLYMLLAFCCLRSRQDMQRLLMALLGTGLIVALIGIVQFIFFKNTLTLEDGVRRVHAMYGSANSIGLLFDYVLPIGLAWALVKTQANQSFLSTWRTRLLLGVICLIMFVTLLLTQSHGAWLAMIVAFLFVGAFSIRNKRVLQVSGAICAVLAAIVLIFFHNLLIDVLIGGHTDAQGVTTLEKRLILWQAALNMIHDKFWLGVGMDNWLCNYSFNTVCQTHLFHYWDSTNIFTGKKLRTFADEAFLSHPHNVFLHVWVSTGVFGFLAFVAILILFFWLFARLMKYLRTHETAETTPLQWMTVGVGAGMLTAMLQGLGDSAFLEQDLAFCFWMTVAALLLLRLLSGMPWIFKTRKAG